MRLYDVPLSELYTNMSKNDDYSLLVKILRKTYFFMTMKAFLLKKCMRDILFIKK